MREIKNKQWVYTRILPVAAIIAILVSVFGPEAFIEYKDRTAMDMIVIGEKSELQGFRFDSGGFFDDGSGNDITGMGFGFGDRPGDGVGDGTSSGLGAGAGAGWSAISDALLREGAGELSGDENPINSVYYVYDKLRVISNASKNRSKPRSDYSVLIKTGSARANEPGQNYTMLPNYRNPITDKNGALRTLSTELSELYSRGIIPNLNWDLRSESYEINSYLAADALEMQKSFPVVAFEFNDTAQLSRRDTLIADCYMDAETNKVISISFRSDKDWSYYNPDQIIFEWIQYVGLTVPESAGNPGSAGNAGNPGNAGNLGNAGSSSAPGIVNATLGVTVHEVAVNPLLESATYLKKYSVVNAEGYEVIITIGFYDGIKEFFISVL